MVTETHTRKGGRVVGALPAIAAFVVGACSFILSYVAQSAVAADLGAVPEQFSGLVPIIVDGGVIAGSSSLWQSSKRGTKKDPVAYFAVFGLLILSVVINIHHASAEGGLLGGVIAGAPPIVLLLTIELMVSQSRREAVASVAKTVSVPLENVSQVEKSGPATPVTPPAPAPSPSITAPARAHVAPPAPRPAAVLAPVAITQPATPAAAGDTEPAQDEHKEAAKAAKAAGPSTAEQVRARFAEHVRNGGDPADRSLVASIAEALGAPVASVRRTVSEERKALART